VIFYCLAKRRLADVCDAQPTNLVVSPVKQHMLVIGSGLFATSYLFVLVNRGLLFRRIGHEGLAMAMLDLSLPEFAVMRVFDRMAIPLICLLVIIVSQARQSSRNRRLAFLSLAITASVWLFVSGLNSRQIALQTILLGLAMWVYWARSYIRLNSRLICGGAIAALVALYTVNLTLNVRAEWVDKGADGLRLEWFNPFYVRQEQNNRGQDHELAHRLNGVDLMARITPRARAIGYSWGEAWWPCVVVQVGQFVAPEIAREYKSAMATTSKYYLMREYAGIYLPDYPNCTLTDIYGNLGPAGLTLAAVAIAVLLAWTNRGLAHPRSSFQLVVAVVAAQELTRFESEFLSMTLLSWVTNLPVLLTLLVINPIKVLTPRPLSNPLRGFSRVMPSPRRGMRYSTLPRIQSVDRVPSGKQK